MSRVINFAVTVHVNMKMLLTTYRTIYCNWHFTSLFQNFAKTSSVQIVFLQIEICYTCVLNID